MIIAGASLSFAASYRYEASQQSTQRSNGLGVQAPKRAEAPDSPMSSLREAVAQLEHESSATQSDYQSGRLAKQASQHHARQIKSDGGAERTPEQQRVQAMLEKTFGVKGIQQFDMKLDYSATQEIQAEVQQSSVIQSGESAGQSGDYHEAYREYESSSLAMAGTFTTEDGRAFSFSLDYQRQREYTSTTDVSYRSGDVARDRRDGGFGAINKPESLSAVQSGEAKSSLLVQMRLAVIGLQALLAPIIQQDGEQKSKGETNQAGAYLKDADQADLAKIVDLMA
jgi:hypothetical protein